MKAINTFIFVSLFLFTTSLWAEDRTSDVLHQALDSLREQSGVAGFSLAVVQDGQLLYEVSSGFIDKDLSRPVIPDTRFRLASVSKVVAASLFADLIQQGKASEHDSLEKWLPELPVRFHPITIYQLMNHTSGVPHYQARDACCWDTQYDSAIDSLEEVIDRELLFEPGTGYEYSSFGYTILAAVYEKVTGETIYQGVSNFSQTLSATSTPLVENVTIRNRLRSNVFELSSHGAQSVSFDNKSYSALGGGLSASAGDIALFADRVVNGSHYSEASKQLLFTVDSSFPNTDSALYQQAFGWRVGEDFDGNRVYHHAGVTLGARSFVVAYPDENLTIAFLSNASWVSQMETNGFAVAQVVLNATELEQAAENVLVQGQFNNTNLQATLECIDQLCSFMEHQNVLSSWLNRFNYVTDRKEASEHSTWPAYKIGNDILLVTSIGLVYLKSEGNEWHGQIGANRELVLNETTVNIY